MSKRGGRDSGFFGCFSGFAVKEALVVSSVVSHISSVVSRHGQLFRGEGMIVRALFVMFTNAMF